MADDALRALARRWRATGAPEDEAAWLAARVRAGDLTPAALVAAARLGHPAARLALGTEAPALADDVVLALRDRPVTATSLARVGLAWAEALLPLWLGPAGGYDPQADHEAARAAIAQAGRCLAAADDQVVALALAIELSLELVRIPRLGTLEPLRSAGHALHAAARLAAAAARARVGAPPAVDLDAQARALSVMVRPLVGTEPCRTIAAALLVPELLGHDEA